MKPNEQVDRELTRDADLVQSVETLSFPDTDAWEAWLADHHERPEGVWLKIAKKGSGQQSVTVSDALDVALCYGWIDSQRRGLDETHFLQRYSRRRSGSSWSRVNVERVEKLFAAGRMRSAGIAEVERAKADGRWAAAYASQATASVPEELTQALAGDPIARARFEALNKTERYLTILPLLLARTPKGRAQALAQTLDRLTKEEGA